MLNNNKQGRRKGEIWNYFTKGQKLNSSHYQANCIYCNLSVRGVNKIMTKHLQECPEVDEDLCAEFSDLFELPKKRTKNDDNDSQEMTELNDDERNTVNKKTLSTEILENVHTNIESQIEKFVAESKFLTLGDGWTDVSQHSIISFVLTNEKRISHLWKTEDFSSQRHTGINIFNKYKEIVHFCSSNLAISKLRELAENYNLRFQYPCITRWGSFIKVAEQILKYKNQLKIMAIAHPDILESEHANLGHVIASWAWLRGVIEKIPSNLDSIKINLGQEIEKRWKKIYDPIFLVTWYLHPFHHGNGINPSLDPTRFWKSVLALCPNLSAFASRLFAIPPNSATSERIWSLFVNIHTG
ncbi:7873_t:CDS:2 [Entrophospora sp. SA101]|nr:10889_t:CDS:2 [Entrophospora sp. SA101]CAJ0827797.1 7873_t:CDS:2 [Entrophospora sp. SA101]